MGFDGLKRLARDLAAKVLAGEDLVVIPRTALEELRAAHNRAVAASGPGEAIEAGRLTGFQRDALIEHVRSGIADMDAPFGPIFARCKDFTMTSADRMYAMFKASDYVVRAGVPGALVECGVWRGGSMMVSALTLAALGATERALVLYDTFEGLPAPNPEVDVDLWGVPAIESWRQRQEGSRDTWANCSLEEVRRNLLSTGYPERHIRFVKGLVEETIPATMPEAIALLRIDTDWHASVAHILAHLYDRVAPGGVVIVDDYGHFAGARKAVDDFIARRDLKVLLQRIDYTGRLFLKP